LISSGPFGHHLGCFGDPILHRGLEEFHTEAEGHCGLRAGTRGRELKGARLSGSTATDNQYGYGYGMTMYARKKLESVRKLHGMDSQVEQLCQKLSTSADVHHE
jgi:hypothetical protein